MLANAPGTSLCKWQGKTSCPFRARQLKASLPGAWPLGLFWRAFGAFEHGPCASGILSFQKSIRYCKAMTKDLSAGPPPRVTYLDPGWTLFSPVYWQLESKDDVFDLSPKRGMARIALYISISTMSVVLLVFFLSGKIPIWITAVGVLISIGMCTLIYAIFNKAEGDGPILIFEKATRRVHLPREKEVLEGTDGMELHVLKHWDLMPESKCEVARLYLVLGVGARRPRGVPLIASSFTGEIERAADEIARQLSLQVTTVKFKEAEKPFLVPRGKFRRKEV